MSNQARAYEKNFSASQRLRAATLPQVGPTSKIVNSTKPLVSRSHLKSIDFSDRNVHLSRRSMDGHDEWGEHPRKSFTRGSDDATTMERNDCCNSGCSSQVGTRSSQSPKIYKIQIESSLTTENGIYRKVVGGRRHARWYERQLFPNGECTCMLLGRATHVAHA